MLVNLAEAVHVSCRVHGLAEEEVRDVVEPLIASVTISTVVPSEETAWRAAQIRIGYYSRKARPISLADCFLLASVGEGDSIATSDPPVAEVARAGSIGVIPLPDSTGDRP